MRLQENKKIKYIWDKYGLKKNKINMNNIKTHIYLNDDEIKLKTT